MTFARVLRGASLRVPIGSVLMFVEALGRVGISERDHVYWAARSTLVHRPEDLPVFDRAFAVFWDHATDNAAEMEPDVIKITLATDDDSESDDQDAAGEPNDDPTLTLRFSSVEVLRNKDFGAYDDDELELAQQLMSRLRFAGPPRRSLPLPSIVSRLAARSAGNASQCHRRRRRTHPALLAGAGRAPATPGVAARRQRLDGAVCQSDAAVRPRRSCRSPAGRGVLARHAADPRDQGAQQPRS